MDVTGSALSLFGRLDPSAELVWLDPQVIAMQ